VGADHYWDIVGDVIIGGDGPTAVESKVGYLLSGPAPVTTGQFLTTCDSVRMLTVLPIEFSLERFWNIESVGVTPPDDCSDDSVVDRYLSSCVTHDCDGAYVARSQTTLIFLLITKQRTNQLVKHLLKVSSRIIAEQEAKGLLNV